MNELVIEYSFKQFKSRKLLSRFSSAEIEATNQQEVEIDQNKIFILANLHFSHSDYAI